MSRTTIGELEELLLLAIAVLMPDAYGYSIKVLILEQSKREVNLSAIHSALFRLETKGLVKSSFGEATKVRGGKRKKLFSLTPAGAAVISEIRNIRNMLWESISPSTIKS